MTDNWFSKANCRGVSSEIFFPEIPSGDIRDFYWSEARAYCKDCPVVKECLAWVLPFEKATHRRDGFWANMTPRERTQYEKRTRA